jgi:hypothetical protein
MSVDFITKGENKFKVVLSCDSAITCPKEDYKKYLETLDENILLLSKEPTRIVMRKRLPYKLAQKVQASQMLLRDGEVQFNAVYFLEDVRAALCGVENAPDAEYPLEFKQDGDGGAHAEVMEQLIELGVTMDLFAARRTAVDNKAELLKKK